MSAAVPPVAGGSGEGAAAPTNFIRERVIEERGRGMHAQGIVTRFPPEPNGYLHIGHAKSICLNFGIAREFGGRCHLRFDDTNPVTEDAEYVRSIQEDVRWLGFEWDALYYASDYFEQCYEYALQLIDSDRAYVCDLSADEVRAQRGTLTEPGTPSPFRNRSRSENRELFERMRAGEFADNSRTLRAKIDMASPNINLRDPVLYRIRRSRHHRTGDQWVIYPMYDYAHPISDMIEDITHSLCTLEFEDHRPFYDWVLETLGTRARPKQIEFARLNINYTVMSKRKLLELVQQRHVSGWDDPRLPTLQGMRRRGYPAAAIRDFCERIGVTKKESVIEIELLENCVREELDRTALRRMAVLRPLKLVINNYPAGPGEAVELANHPQHPELGTRRVPFGREVWIESEDFKEAPPPKYHRLVPGGEVRLRGAYIVKCERIEKDAAGNVTVVHCTYDPSSRSGAGGEARKVKGTIHWVSAEHARAAEVRLYDRLASVASPGAGGADYLTQLNPHSLEVIERAWVEPSLGEARASAPDGSDPAPYQFERTGYFVIDRKDSSAERLVFNRTVSLRDTWAKK